MCTDQHLLACLGLLRGHELRHLLFVECHGDGWVGAMRGEICLIE